jgi:pimeloyl-ACP methyl ester carboxylesterase
MANEINVDLVSLMRQDRILFHFDQSLSAMNDRVNRRPDPRLLLAEGPRALAEITSLIPATSFLYLAPRGDGHPVLFLPGLGAGDGSTTVLRGFLSTLGYQSYSWNLGTNLGPSMPNLLVNLSTRLNQVFTATGARKVSIVGWSLGGVYARVLAHHHPEKVRQVITLGSPFAGSPRSTSSQERLLAGEPLPGVPSSAVFSKSDAIVPWRMATQQPTEIAENVEVYTGHIGLGFSPAVLYAAADRLATREGKWQPLQRTSWKRLVYGPAVLEPGNSSGDRSYQRAAGA